MSEKFNCSRSISILHIYTPCLFLISKFTFPPGHLSGKFAIILIWTAELTIISSSTSVNLTFFFLFMFKKDPQNLLFLMIYSPMIYSPSHSLHGSVVELIPSILVQFIPWSTSPLSLLYFRCESFTQCRSLPCSLQSILFTATI